MAIRLNDLSKIATIIKTKYGNNLYKMNFIFCCKKDVNSYFIFQEIQGMPIKRIVYHGSNNSVTFVASWSCWSNPFAMVVDANFDKIENWKDLQDRTRPYNSYIEEGGFNNNYWKSINKYNKTEKKKKHKDKSDTFVEFRIDRIQRANFNEWGFELYSPTISMIGFQSRYDFPYDVSDVEQSSGNTISNYAATLQTSYGFIQSGGSQSLDEDGISMNKVTWQGGSFNIPEFQSSGEVSQVSSHNNQGHLSANGTSGEYDLSSYWCSKESDKENELFDEEMMNMLLDDRVDDETIFDVGQKRTNLNFDD